MQEKYLAIRILYYFWREVHIMVAFCLYIWKEMIGLFQKSTTTIETKQIVQQTLLVMIFEKYYWINVQNR